MWQAPIGRKPTKRQLRSRPDKGSGELPAFPALLRRARGAGTLSLSSLPRASSWAAVRGIPDRGLLAPARPITRSVTVQAAPSQPLHEWSGRAFVLKKKNDRGSPKNNRHGSNRRGPVREAGRSAAARARAVFAEPRLPSPHLRPPWRAPTRRAGTIKNTTSTAAYTRRGLPRLQVTRLFFGMVVQKYSAACRRVHRPP